MNFTEFVSQNVNTLLEQFPDPLFAQEINELNKANLNWLAKVPKRKGFVSQVSNVVLPMFKLLTDKSKTGIINAEMGTGKTTMSNLIAGLLFHNEYESKGMNVMFLASGSKHENKMKREAIAILDDIVSVHIIRLNPRRRRGEITIEEALDMPKVAGRINYFILSKDSGKNSFKSKAFDDISFCPSCGNGLTEKVRKLTKAEQVKLRLGLPDVPIKRAGKSIYSCACGEKTWTTTGGKRSIGEIVTSRMKNKYDKFFDLLIVDEVHEMQNPNSLQTIMYKNIAQASYRKIIMTGTLSNGYASSIFHILYPLFSKHFKEYGGFDYDKIGSFVDFFGFKMETSKVKIDGIGSKRKSVSIQELPQINDRIVGFLAPYTVWFSIEDLNIKMPKFSEKPLIMEIDPIIKERFESWSEKVLTLKDFFNDAKLYQFKSALHYRLNNPCYPYVHEVEEIVPAEDFEVPLVTPEGAHIEYLETENKFRLTASIPFEPIESTFVSSKESELLNLVQNELEEGRRMIIYGLHNESIDLYDRLINVLVSNGIDAEAMPSSLKSEDIEQWLIDYKKDVVIVPQKRVATGLDLVMFHTVIFYEMDTQLRVVQQAKVRPWRPVGQDKNVRCFYLAFKGNQESQLISMAQKMRAAATVEGKILEKDSIAALYDYNPEMTAAVAEISLKIDSGDVNFEYEDDVTDAIVPLTEMEQYYKDLLDEEMDKIVEEEIEINDTEIAFVNDIDEVPEEPEVIEIETKVEEIDLAKEIIPLSNDISIEISNDEVEREDISPIDVVVERNGQMAFVF